LEDSAARARNACVRDVQANFAEFGLAGVLEALASLSAKRQ
jgi:hypothetical protein